MPDIPSGKRSIGMAALVVFGLLAGFFVANSAAGDQFATVGTVADDNQAYAMPLEEDEEARFVLQAHEDAANPETRFAVYDPSDRFFGYFDLAGDGDDVEMLSGTSGSWVVFVTQAQDADLAIQREGADANSSEELEAIEVKDHERTIASSDNGSLDEEFALRIDQRPAVAFLEFSGDIAGLDATVESEEGTVYRISDGAANTTEDGAVRRSGQTELTPANLAEGTYRIQAQADEFAGELVFVYQTYDRGATVQETNASVDVEKPLEDASIVAHAQEHEAYEVPMQGADQLAFAVKGDTEARILVYNQTDAVTEIVELEASHGYDDWSWDENGSENRSDDHQPFDVARINVTDDRYTVFVQDVCCDSDRVIVALPDVADAEPAQELKIEKQEVVFDHGGNESQTAQAELPGGLVGVGVHSRDILSFERKVNVTGPHGEIAVIEQRASSFGWSWGMYDEYEVVEENFSAGTMDIAFEQDSLLGQGKTTVELAHYVPAK